MAIFQTETPLTEALNAKGVWKNHDFRPIIIIIISGFGIYGAAVVPDSGVGNTWQRFISQMMQDRAIVTVEGE